MGKLFKLNYKISKEMTINGVDFKIFDESDEDWVQSVFERYKINAWELCFHNFLMCNVENNKFVFSIENECLCIYLYYSKSKVGQLVDLCFIPFPLDGNNKRIAKAFAICDSRLKKVNGDCKSKCILLNADMIMLAKKCIYDISKDKEFNDITYNLDYLYLMNGSRLKNKRRDYNKFKRDYPNAHVVEYDPKIHMDRCKQLFNKWKNIFRSRTKESVHCVKTYKYVFEQIINTDSSHCYVLVDGDKVIGYMNVFLLYSDVCMCDKRISDDEYYGSSNFLLLEVCKILNEMGYSYMNDGNTGGDTNLRLFKMGYTDNDECESINYVAYIK